MPPNTQQPVQKRSVHELEPRFTVFLRLPFPRGDFVDPVSVSTQLSVYERTA